MRQLATVREPLDYDKGLDVVDSRTGETLAWRGGDNGASAVELADHLNEVYPPGTPWPAHDTLVHEIIGWRITGVAG
jgi:hypothetical protein